jgi:hypothetical protein
MLQAVVLPVFYNFKEFDFFGDGAFYSSFLIKKTE